MSGKNRSISLNCSLSTPASLTTPTPNTPEILNAIINISSHHLEKISANEIELKKEKTTENDQADVANAGQGRSSQQMHEDNNINRYHSQFIREGLKMKVKQKIKEETFQTLDASLGFNDINDGGANLTFEDEERRLRRRERNKVAATKCRNKKKERTTRLIAEGEVLEIQNSALKEELRKLEAEARSLGDLLGQHSQVCLQKRQLESDSSSESRRKQRKVDQPRAPLVAPERSHKTDYENNMEAFQSNYYHGLNLDNPEVSIKSEDPGHNFYEARGYFSHLSHSHGYSMFENQSASSSSSSFSSSFCLPSYGLSQGPDSSMCLAL